MELIGVRDLELKRKPGLHSVSNFPATSLLPRVLMQAVTHENNNTILVLQAKKRTLNNVLYIRLRDLKRSDLEEIIEKRIE